MTTLSLRSAPSRLRAVVQPSFSFAANKLMISKASGRRQAASVLTPHVEFVACHKLAKAGRVTGWALAAGNHDRPGWIAVLSARPLHLSIRARLSLHSLGIVLCIEHHASKHRGQLHGPSVSPLPFPPDPSVTNSRRSIPVPGCH